MLAVSSVSQSPSKRCETQDLKHFHVNMATAELMGTRATAPSTQQGDALITTDVRRDPSSIDITL